MNIGTLTASSSLLPSASAAATAFSAADKIVILGKIMAYPEGNKTPMTKKPAKPLFPTKRPSNKRSIGLTFQALEK